MTDLLQKMLNFLQTEKLTDEKDTVLLTVSGGIDSVVMTNLFYEANISFAIAHCNFGLRGEESDGDKQFVKNMALEMNVPFFSKKFDTKKFAVEQGISTQMAARKLRYDWFASLPFSKIATAHHAGDNAETIMLNMLRGTGIRGLVGIKAKRGKIIRPLLFASREDILRFAHEKKIAWREDSSNQSSHYKRNFIRHHVAPQLAALAPNYEKIWLRNAKKIQQAEQIVAFSLQKMLQNWLIFDKEIQILPIEKVVKLPFAEAILWHWLQKYGFKYAQIEKLVQEKFATGKKFLSLTHCLSLDRGNFILFELKRIANKNYFIQDSFGELLIENKQKLRWQTTVKSGAVIFPKNHQRVLIDADRLIFPLELRNWREGDAFEPLGMGGKSKKISDLLIEKKIPLQLKGEVRVLVSAGQIVWVLGLRSSERHKITEKTQHIFEMEILGLS